MKTLMICEKSYIAEQIKDAIDNCDDAVFYSFCSNVILYSLDGVKLLHESERPHIHNFDEVIYNSPKKYINGEKFYVSGSPTVLDTHVENIISILKENDDIDNIINACDDDISGKAMFDFVIKSVSDTINIENISITDFNLNEVWSKSEISEWWNNFNTKTEEDISLD